MPRFDTGAGWTQTEKTSGSFKGKRAARSFAARVSSAVDSLTIDKSIFFLSLSLPLYAILRKDKREKERGGNARGDSFPARP